MTSCSPSPRAFTTSPKRQLSNWRFVDMKSSPVKCDVTTSPDSILRVTTTYVGGAGTSAGTAAEARNSRCYALLWGNRTDSLRHSNSTDATELHAAAAQV